MPRPPSEMKRGSGAELADWEAWRITHPTPFPPKSRLIYKPRSAPCVSGGAYGDTQLSPLACPPPDQPLCPQAYLPRPILPRILKNIQKSLKSQD